MLREPMAQRQASDRMRSARLWRQSAERRSAAARRRSSLRTHFSHRQRAGAGASLHRRATCASRTAPRIPDCPARATRARIHNLYGEILTLRQTVSAWIYTQCCIRCKFNFCTNWLRFGDKYLKSIFSITWRCQVALQQAPPPISIASGSGWAPRLLHTELSTGHWNPAMACLTSHRCAQTPQRPEAEPAWLNAPTPTTIRGRSREISA